MSTSSTGSDPGSLTAHAEATFNVQTGTGLHADDAGVTGSNISELGGLITPQDIASGSINHALRYATPIDSPSFVSPASRSDGGTGGGIPAGELMRLDPSLNLSQFGLTPFQLMVAQGAFSATAPTTPTRPDRSRSTRRTRSTARATRALPRDCRGAS